MDGFDLTSIYSVCSVHEIFTKYDYELDKETRQRKELWKEPNDESSTNEAFDESSIIIKSELRSKKYRT